MSDKTKKIILIKPRGFCAGVTRAVKIVEKALEKFGEPVFVKHQIVHNKRVVNMLKKKGAIFVESLNDIPEGSITIFSAHGVTPQVRKEAEARNLKIIDATCPLVNKVHIEAKKFSEEGYTVLLLGHAGHPEVIGVMGEAPICLIETLEDIENLKIPDEKKVACLTQTTLSIDDTKEFIEKLKKRFPNLILPPKEDICYATQNRQAAVKKLVRDIDLLLVIASKSSSNSNRLSEIGAKSGVASLLISDPSEIGDETLECAEKIGITAGASTPDIMVNEAINYIKSKYPNSILEELDCSEEEVSFSLPRELAD